MFALTPLILYGVCEKNLSCSSITYSTTAAISWTQLIFKHVTAVLHVLQELEPSVTQNSVIRLLFAKTDQSNKDPMQYCGVKPSMSQNDPENNYMHAGFELRQISTWNIMWKKTNESKGEREVAF